jgi:putative membrane-bound dehydrogenase-like protein
MWSSITRLSPVVAFTAIATTVLAQGYAPEDAVGKMTPAEGLEVSLVAAEPLVRQPVSIEFDDRGRLWVVQYLQYPNPSGLERVAVDRYSRTKYDRLPKPPPHGPKGADCITILIDEDRDGLAESSKDFVSGLNLASGLAFGYDGVFILQTPYLLYYPDKNHDDVPDGDPEVCLTGFGMEDAHSVANSLMWGPDGWLYGNQGSTVTANIRGIEFQQGVWRYHPRTKEFELFIEGGGNMWGLDYDRDGQILASTNYGPSIIIHAVQGAYYWKSFGKHGDLHNPFTYGYFDHVKHHNPKGGHVVTGGQVYQGGSLPERFDNSYIAANLLSHNVQWNTLTEKGTTFESHLQGSFLESNDTWFAPSDMTTGPDGAIYVCDFHDARMAHPDPDADWDRRNGRIFRIAPKGHSSDAPFDLRTLDSKALVELLDHKNAWFARRARVLLASRQDTSVSKTLKDNEARNANRTLALESLWTRFATGDTPEKDLKGLLSHDDFAFRLWGVRLLGDQGAVSNSATKALTKLARREKDVRVLSQLAATAQRLESDQSIKVVNALLENATEDNDLYLPLLLWWAIEPNSAEAARSKGPLRKAESSLVEETLRPRLIRRLVAQGDGMWDDACTDLLGEPYDPEHLNLLLEHVNHGLDDRAGRQGSTMRGALYASYSETATEEDKGDAESPLSPALISQLVNLWEKAPEHPVRLALATRINHDPALTLAGKVLRDPQADTALRVALLAPLSRAAGNGMVPELLALAIGEEPNEIRSAALGALRRFDDASIGTTLATAYPQLPPALLVNTRQLLFSRAAWTRNLLELVDSGALDAGAVPVSELRRVAQHDDTELNALVQKHWGNVSGGTPEALLAEMRRLNNDLRAKPGDPVAGSALFTANCAQCHKFFGEGHAVGPDLTQSNRMDTEYLLASLVNPNQVVRKEYLQFLIETEDGGFYNGIVSERSPGSVTLLNANEEKTSITFGDIAEIREAGISLMPEGLLSALTPDELRNLFAYLQKKEAK